MVFGIVPILNLSNGRLAEAASETSGLATCWKGFLRRCSRTGPGRGRHAGCAKPQAARLTEDAAHMVEQRRIRFLTVIWGARYVEEFCLVALPSFLAPGNLPHLAAETDLEVLVMTSEASIPAFEAQAMFRRLQETCPVRFILIDDLITNGLYGVTLTLAYARGIRDSGEAQTETDFVFMNSDFVLADGSLATLLAMLRAGHRCVLAPSLRARSEKVLPLLQARVDAATRQLAMPPREMVGLALANLHPTVVGKTVSQNFVTSSTHNQVYWQVDRDTLLARHYLIFMLAIRPERLLGAVNSYCDYGFVPEMVPSGAMTVLGDSDGFFMLEMQATDQEKQVLRCGRATIPEIAGSLSSWTTDEHRRVAEFEIVFHASDLPAGLDAARRGHAEFMGRLRAALSQPPLSHVAHPYWVGGVEAWALHKAETGGALPPELLPPGVAPDPAVVPADAAELAAAAGEGQPAAPGSLAGGSAVEAAAALLGRIGRHHRGIGRGLLGLHQKLLLVGRRLLGKPPNVPLWHHEWADVQLGLAALKTPPEARRSLLVCSDGSILRRAAEARPEFDVHFGLEGFIRGEAAADAGTYDYVVLHVLRAAAPRARDAIEAAERLLRPGGSIAVYFEHPDAEVDPSNFTAELSYYIENVLPQDWLAWRIEARFSGGRAKRDLTLLERALFRRMVLHRPADIPTALLAVGLWPPVAAGLAIHNLLSLRDADDCPPFCTSALIRLRCQHSGAAPGGMH